MYLSHPRSSREGIIESDSRLLFFTFFSSVCQPSQDAFLFPLFLLPPLAPLPPVRRKLTPIRVVETMCVSDCRSDADILLSRFFFQSLNLSPLGLTRAFNQRYRMLLYCSERTVLHRLWADCGTGYSASRMSWENQLSSGGIDVAWYLLTVDHRPQNGEDR